jgi:hypothetical protein
MAMLEYPVFLIVLERLGYKEYGRVVGAMRKSSHPNRETE